MIDNRTYGLHASLHGLSRLATPMSKPGSESSEWPDSHSSAGSALARVGPNTKIVVIARERLIRDCLVRCLQGANGNTIESVATVAEWIATRTTELPPSFILLCGYGLGDRAAEIEGDLRALAELGSNVPVVLVSDEVDVNRIQAAFALGVRGYIPTNVPLDVALSALRVVQVGGTFVPASSLFELQAKSGSANPNSEPRNAVLTPTQTAVAEAIRQGKANKQIAYELDMGESTVKVHIRNIMKKLSAKNRTEVAVKLDELLRTSPGAASGG